MCCRDNNFLLHLQQAASGRGRCENPFTNKVSYIYKYDFKRPMDGQRLVTGNLIHLKMQSEERGPDY